MRRSASLRVGLGVVALLLLLDVQAYAGVHGRLWQNQSSRVGNAALTNIPPEPPDAEFNPAAIDYDSRISGYTLAQFLHFPTFYNVSGTFDPNGTLNNTFFLFTGDTYLNAGANNFVVPHDDGLQLNIDGIGLVVDHPGPTAPVITPFTVNAPTAGMYHFELSYGEGFGPPGVLAFQINGEPVGVVPLPAAAWAGLSMLAGLGGFWVIRRKRIG